MWLMYPTTRLLYHFGTIYEEFWGIFIYVWNYEKIADKLALKKIIQEVVKTLNFDEKMWEEYCKSFKFIVLTHIGYSITILSQYFGWKN